MGISNQPSHSFHIPLRGVIYRDGEWWISHCLDMDVVGQGATPEEAFQQSVELCGLQIESALADGDLASIVHPAPPEYWALFYRSHGQRHHQSLADGPALADVEFRVATPA